MFEAAMSDAVLSLSGVTKSYGALLASDDVSLDVRRGEVHALIGPNGAGKSTLIKQIVGEIISDSGTVSLEGRDITGLDAPARIRAGLARSFQISSLIPEFTVLQNVMLAVMAHEGRVFRFFRTALKDRLLVTAAMEELSRVGMSHRAGVRASDISHGERRRLEMAVALSLKPRVFLLDEPMAGMGPEGSKELTGFLDGLRDEAPILLVEHDMDAVFALADRISVLVNGRIIATGRAEEIRNSEVVRRAYLGEGA